MVKQKLLISSCLFGELVRYDGNHNKISDIDFKRLQEKYDLLSFCPEVEGGLSTPREACEIVSTTPLQIITKSKIDQTKEFEEGALKALNICKQQNIITALLKSNSPSCSSKFIYDGTFSSVKVKGVGVTTQLLKENNIAVFDEYEIEKLL